MGRKSELTLIAIAISLLLCAHPAAGGEGKNELFEYRGKFYPQERFKNIVAQKGLVCHKDRWMTRHERLGLELEEKDPGLFDIKKVVGYASPAIVCLRVDGSKIGSGTPINSNGLFITNWYVVKDARDIKVRLYRGKGEFNARVVVHSESHDLALASIGGTDRPYLKLAEPDGIAAGDRIAAMGNPFGLSTTATLGIISSIRKLKNFPDVNIEQLRTRQKELIFIQTDAAVNPGNSGGQLLSDKGKIVGINTFGIPKNIAEWLNFAIHAAEIEGIYSYYFEK